MEIHIEKKIVIGRLLSTNNITKMSISYLLGRKSLYNSRDSLTTYSNKKLKICKPREMFERIEAVVETRGRLTFMYIIIVYKCLHKVPKFSQREFISKKTPTYLIRFILMYASRIQLKFSMI